MNLFAQAIPEGLTDAIGMPAVLTLVGLGLWYAGLHYENRTEKSWLKWCAFIPLIIGVVIAFPKAMEAFDYTTQRLYPNKKVLYGVYIAPILPLGALLTVIGWHFYLKKQGSYERF